MLILTVAQILLFYCCCKMYIYIYIVRAGVIVVDRCGCIFEEFVSKIATILFRSARILLGREMYLDNFHIYVDAHLNFNIYIYNDEIIF